MSLLSGSSSSSNRVINGHDEPTSRGINGGGGSTATGGGLTPGGGRFVTRLSAQEREISLLKEQYASLLAHCEALEVWKEGIEKWIREEFGSGNPVDEDEGGRDGEEIGDLGEDQNGDDDFVGPSIVHVTGAVGVQVPVELETTIPCNSENTRGKDVRRVSTPSGTSTPRARQPLPSDQTLTQERVGNKRKVQVPVETNCQTAQGNSEERQRNKPQKLKYQSPASASPSSNSNSPSPTKTVEINDVNAHLRSPRATKKTPETSPRRSSPRTSKEELRVGTEPRSPPKKKPKRDDPIASTSSGCGQSSSKGPKKREHVGKAARKDDSDSDDSGLFQVRERLNTQTSAASQKLEIQDDAPCSVCWDVEIEPNNTIIFCDKCNLPVHQACYGVRDVPEGKWFCNPCKQNKDPSSLSCRFCLKKGGALKPVHSPRKDWAHVWCTWWIQDVKMGSSRTQEPVMGVQNIKKDWYALKCVICKVKGGVAIQCVKGKCTTAFHPTCAQENGFRMDRIDHGETLEHKAYCRKCSTTENAKDAKELAME